MSALPLLFLLVLGSICCSQHPILNVLRNGIFADTTPSNRFLQNRTRYSPTLWSPAGSMGTKYRLREKKSLRKATQSVTKHSFSRRRRKADEIGTTTVNSTELTERMNSLQNNTESSLMAISETFQATPNTSSLDDTSEIRPFPWIWSGSQLVLPANENFCSVKNGLILQQHITCYCDAFCDLFHDCCLPYLSCNEIPTATTTTALNITANQIECRSQGSKLNQFNRSDFTRGRPGYRFFWMVSTCTSRTHISTLRQKCEFSGFTTDLDLLCPVSDPVTKLTFKNKFCAACNNVFDTPEWDTMFKCANTTSFYELSVNVTSIQDLVKRIDLKSDCSLFFKPPKEFPGRPCAPIGYRHYSGLRWFNLCGPKNSFLQERCTNAPFTLVQVTAGRDLVYSRNVFCWLCRQDELPDRFTDCSELGESQVNANRGYDPVGLGALIDMSHKKDWCEPQTGTAQCFVSKVMEQDKCFSPVVGVFNGYYDLKLLITPQNEPNVSKNHTDWTNCKSIVYDIFSIKFYYSWQNEWEFLNQKITCTAMTVDVNETSGKTFERTASVYNIPVALKRKTNSYIEGIPFFEYLLDGIAEYLQQYGIVSHNGVDYKVSLIREERQLCEDVEREARINTVPPHSYGTEHHVPNLVALLCACTVMFSLLNGF